MTVFASVSAGLALLKARFVYTELQCGLQRGSATAVFVTGRTAVSDGHSRRASGSRHDV